MKARSFLFAACLAASLSVGSVLAAPPVPSLNSPEFAKGPYSAMHMLLEKTFLNVDVLTVDVRFGKHLHPRLQEIAKGKKYSESVGKQVADVAIQADDALVQLKFKRDVSLSMWIDAVRENLEQARQAGLITADVEKKVSQGLPKWFAALKERGYKENDRLLYRVRADSLRTVVVSADGKILVDKLDKDKVAPRVVMASYFAPKSDFREPLLRSFFK
ncbi:MAG TPA: hypothetical protein VKY73_08650 [Polyangiaceae bacterium]|nr:hypothetical protein [Polyangiaceae bacterium]